MSTDAFIPVLAAFTLLVGLGVGIWLLAAFLRKRRNREIMKDTLSN